MTQMRRTRSSRAGGTTASGGTRCSRRQMMIGAALGSLGMAGLAACSPPEPAARRSASGASDGDGEIVILTHDSFTLPPELLEAFTEQTGLRLTTVAAGTAGVANQLVLNSSLYDGFYGLDSFTAGVALEHGVVDSYTSPSLPAEAQALITEKLTPVDSSPVSINIDRAWFDAEGLAPPASLVDLALPEYAPLTVLSNPAESTTGFAFLAGVYSSLADPHTYLEAVLGGGAKIAAGWSEAYYHDFSINEGGQFPLALSYATSPADTEGATSTILDSCVQQVEFAGVVRGAAHPEGARVFVDWLVSPEVQSVLAENMYVLPVRSDVTLPATWEQFAEIPDAPIRPDVAAVHRHRDTWLDTWAEIAER